MRSRFGLGFVNLAALALLALLLSTGAQAARKGPPFTQADCADPTLTLVLNTQAAVDSFPCTTVAGDLEISIKRAETILYLPLGQLTRVDGELLLSFSNIGAPTSLDGLVNVAHVGSLSVKAAIPGQPDRLTDISGLASLTSIGPRNCQPALDPADCYTTLALTSDEITQLPAWNIANDSIEDLNVIGFPLTDRTQWDSVPVPSRRLSLSQVDLDTSQSDQLDTLKRLASQATESVTLQAISNLVALPAMPNASRLRLGNVALPDLLAITPAAFPVLDGVALEDLAGISPAELAPIRDINIVTLTGMTGLSGANPLSGLSGGGFSQLFLTRLSNVTTLTDLSSVTALEILQILDMDGLTDLAGLDNLTSIADQLWINKCDKLENVDALSSLASVGSELLVEENPALRDLNGLGGVSGTLREVQVFANPQLTDLSGLAGITGVSETVAVLRNAVSECDVLVKSRLNPQPARTYLVNPACVYASPALSSSATALDFGSGAIGTTIDRSVTFENGTGSLSTSVDISAVSISGDTAGEYSVLSEDCTSGPLTGGSTLNSCTVTVRFTVTQQGPDNVQLDLTYTTSESSTPQSFPVTLHAAGTGVTGDQLIPKDKLDFGQVELGASKTDTITIDNTSGSGPLTVDLLKLKGGDFKLGDNSCGNTYPQTVPVGSQCQVSIRFTPSALNARASLFTMESDGATSPDSVNLLGSGVEPPAPVPTPTSRDFGDVPVGTASARQFVFVKNASPIRSLPLGQPSASGDFAVQSSNCSGTTLPPSSQAGSSCVVYVTFNPTTTGPATGTLTIPGASGYPSASVALSGNGIAAVSLSASPTHLDFGVQNGVANLAVTITNTGTAIQDAQIGAAAVSGTVTPVQFSIVGDDCSSTTLAGQGTCQIEISFDPSQVGADTGTLEIPYDNGRVLDVALSGRGGAPVDNITPASLSFGTIAVGSTSAAQTVTVTDSGGIPLDITSVTTVQGRGFVVQNDSCSGTTVAPGTSCTFDVDFTPLSAGVEVGIIEVVSNSTSSPDQVAVDGTGAGTYNVSATVSGGNGSVSCTPATVSAGDSSTCTAIPDSGYQVASWTGACASAGSNAQCILTNIQSDQGSTVSFVASAPATYSVSATVSGGNGSVSCTPDTVSAAGKSACTAVPGAGYQVQSWSGACAATGSNAYCLLKNIQADQTSTVSFVAIPPSTYSVSAVVSAVVSAGNGTVSCTPANVSAGGSSRCTAVPSAGDQVAGWGGACASAGTNTQCSLTNIQANQSSTVSFSALPPASYHVSANVTGGNGSVSCSPTTVSKGGNSTCTAVPDAGYQVAAWTDACASWGSQDQCYLTKIRADQAATVSFAPIPPASYSVSATVSGGNGHVSCSPTSVTAGDASTCSAVPDAGYQVDAWSGDCAATGSAAQCDLTNIQADQVSSVSFSALPVPTFTIGATVSGGNGTVSCAPSPVPQGDSSSCDAVPDAGYQVQAWTGACAATGANAHCALSNIQADRTSTVSFAAIPPSSYHVSASVVLGHGAVSCTPSTVNPGGTSTCTAVPDTGYQVASWGGDCSGWGTQTQCYLTKIKADKTSTVSFAPLPPANYSVSASVSAGNGHVSCTPTTVTAGDSSSCTAVPDAGWAIDSWGGDCAAAGSATQCDLTNIQADQRATVAFVSQGLPTYSVIASVDGANGTVSCAPSTVPQGDSASCTAVPDSGYQVAAWTGACAATGHTVHCALSNVQADQASTVRFEPIPAASFTVSATVTSGHGAVSCGAGTVTAGSGVRCTAVPDPGYRVLAWGGDCAGAGSQTQCALDQIYSDQNATVSFAHVLPGSYHVSATVSAGRGSVSCSPVTVPKGAASTCTATPEPGYQVDSWDGDCARAGTSSQCYLPKIQKDQTASVRFAAKTLATVRVSALVDGGNGTVSCTPSDVPLGGSTTCTAVPDAGYQVAHWDGACLLAGQSTQCALSNIQSDQRTMVRFVPLPPVSYRVSATVSVGNGSVSCTPATVRAGDDSVCTAAPAAGYQVQSWSGACAASGSQAQCSLRNIQSDQTSTVSFAAIPPSTYSVSALVSAGNGTVSCTPANVSAGGSSRCTAVPGPGDQVAGWGGACASAGTNTQCTLTNIQASQSSTVSFSALPPASYHVSANVTGGNGSVSCTPATVSKGESSTCSAVPDAGFQVQSWGDACASWGSNSQCYLPKIRADQSATVSFEPIPSASYSVSATVIGGNGHVSCSPTSVGAGGASSCTAVPDAGYAVQSWSGACASAGSAAQCALTNVQADQSAAVSFAALPVPTYSLSATVTGGNGSVSCAPSTVPQGDSGSCTAVPDAGYQVGSWSGACASAGTNIDCALTNVQADQTSTVSFTPIPVDAYHVSASVTLGHGTVSCAPTTVDSGGASTCTAVPETGYQVASWDGDCAGRGTQAQCYLTKIKADKSASVSFAPLPAASYSVSATVSAGNGHVSCTPSTVSAGDSSSCTAVPDAGWEIQDWGGACTGTGNAAQCALTNIQSDQSATVSFVAQAVPDFNISATVDGANGSVSCAPSTVPQGDSASCTAVPDTGYQVAVWSGACAATGHIVHCALSNIQADQNSTVRFEPIPAASYSVSATVDSGHGAVSCSPGTVSDGGSSLCSAVPDPGYRVQAWGGDCASAGSQTQCQLSAIHADQVATVSFLHALPGSYQVSASVDGANGSVSCTPTTVAKGEASTCTATPDAGYQVAAWGGDCASAGAATQCYLPKIQKNQTATVSFAARTPDTFSVTALVDGGNGTVSCTPSSVSAGGSSTCTATPDAGYQVAHWDGACLLAGQSTQCALTNIQSDQRTKVGFSRTAQAQVTVTPQASAGGTVEPSDPQVIGQGETVSFQLIPDSLYELLEVTTSGCDGSLVGDLYTTGAVMADCTVFASYGPISIPDRPPVAVDDNYVVPFDSLLQSAAPGLLRNDRDPSGLSLTAQIVSQPTLGTLIATADGGFEYRPTPLDSCDSDQLDSFSYVANNGLEDSNIATATVHITCDNCWDERGPVDRDTRWRVVELYVANFGEAPDIEGVDYWTEAVETRADWNITSVARSFFDQPTVQERFPALLDNEGLLEALYWNLFDRAPDAEGLSYWLEDLAAGRLQREELVVALINGAWANPESLVEQRLLADRVRVSLAFIAEQERVQILYTQLPADLQDQFFIEAVDILKDLDGSCTSYEDAIARIPAAVGRFTP
ncbi:InlB B-repeat-containing protein [Thiorhodococcus minor]|uniref:Choice-of-anchor D domain-containing protein n=1 Tax=Thiorhodococcus minor TaxID=57489 RepID=A0A6M0K2Y6_9GAMM|nr:choice-of-anchor D domain-containing protein [Thiorhodococcus minor]NEV62685.1 choice-of-anchor D domain-containing protein [Thiorhodococcus minor]